MTLPETVQAFFDLPKPATTGQIEAIFVPGAHVRDEARDYHGIEAITTWWRETNETTPFTAVPKSLEENGPVLLVRAEVSGSFQGSPVILGHHFTLRGGKIEELEIK
ncbi:nuclear transport factor 2 family protein [Thalassovita mediterranea]|nr:nuclear transport factor 2 family protein [Thalassovita mediterranea]